MSVEGPGRVVAVVAAPSSADVTLAQVYRRSGGASTDVTVLCPGGDTTQHVTTVLADHDWTATVETVDPFTATQVAVAARRVDPDDVVVGPGVPFAASALRSKVGDVPVQVAPASDDVRRPRLRYTTGLPQRATIFGLALGFYLLLGQLTVFDVVTGVLTATVCVLLLSHVTFTEPPTLRRTLPRVGRAVLFVPYLLWEVVKANLSLAAVLVDPRLPIDPSMETVETEADSALERAVLANSITMTPGTVTVGVRGPSVLVHTLTRSSRASLEERDLERAVRYVFVGRRRETGDATGVER